MIRHEAHLLVELIPPFLKTFEFGLADPNGRRLSSDERDEIDKLEELARKLNTLQVTVAVYVRCYARSELTFACLTHLKCLFAV